MNYITHDAKIHMGGKYIITFGGLLVCVAFIVVVAELDLLTQRANTMGNF